VRNGKKREEKAETFIRICGWFCMLDVVQRWPSIWRRQRMLHCLQTITWYRLGPPLVFEVRTKSHSYTEKTDNYSSTRLLKKNSQRWRPWTKVNRKMILTRLLGNRRYCGRKKCQWFTKS